MIDHTIGFLTNLINEHFKTRFDLNEDKISFSHVINQDGTSALKEQNRIVASIVNIQEERMNKNGARVFGKGSFNESGFFRPPVHLNLYILFAAHFEPQLYAEGLRFLSIIVAFFQTKNVFRYVDFPELHPSIEKLIFELENLSFQEQNNLWGALGAKYVPSVLYKVRMLSISEEDLLQLGTTINDVDQ